MFLPQTFFDQESLESVGKKDNHIKSQVGRVQMLIAIKFFSFKSQSVVPYPPFCGFTQKTPAN